MRNRLRRLFIMLYVNAMIPIRKWGVEKGHITPLEGVIKVRAPRGGTETIGIVCKGMNYLNSCCEIACTDGRIRKYNLRLVKIKIYGKEGWGKWQ